MRVSISTQMPDRHFALRHAARPRPITSFSLAVWPEQFGHLVSVRQPIFGSRFPDSKFPAHPTRIDAAEAPVKRRCSDREMRFEE